jgi:hypothetical protein
LSEVDAGTVVPVSVMTPVVFHVPPGGATITVCVLEVHGPVPDRVIPVITHPVRVAVARTSAGHPVKITAGTTT